MVQFVLEKYIVIQMGIKAEKLSEITAFSIKFANQEVVHILGIGTHLLYMLAHILGIGHI